MPDETTPTLTPTKLRNAPDFMTADPVIGLELGKSLLSLSDQERKTMLAQVRSGELTELTFEAVVFRAQYPNANYVRFRDNDLHALTASFVNQPFLRNHDTRDIGSRDGTIIGSRLSGDEVVQTVRLTSQRGMEDYLQGRIDRFSIGWYYDEVLCSICESDWMHCSHWPGQRYGEEGNRQLCELIFTNPTGKETSAVNVPAVKGTHVLMLEADEEVAIVLGEQLAALCDCKEAYQKEQHAHNSPTLATDPTHNSPTLVTDPAPDTNLSVSHVPSPLTEDLSTMNEDTTTPQEGTMPTPVVEPEVVAAAPVALATVETAGAIAPVQQPAEASEWMTAMRDATISSMLAVSGLSTESQEAVRVAIGEHNVNPARVSILIEAQRRVEARLRDAEIVHGINPAPQTGRIAGVIDGYDKAKEVLFALLDNRRPANGLKPISGIREAYIVLSGDWEMTGRYKSDEISLANINTSTMSDLMAEWLNMRVVTSFQRYDQFWKLFCRTETFTSLRDPHWIKVGGVGELSEVGEGTAYTEKEWIAETETTGWVKRGNWIGITLEAIDRDRTSYIQQLPQALAQGAYLTIAKDFTRKLVTTNGAGFGPTLASDTTPLFHANHANLGSTALSYTAWVATRIAMARQGELGSGEVLGNLTVPRYIMVPRHLEGTAITMLATERVQGSGNNDVNPFVVGGATIDGRIQAALNQIVVNDFFGAANNWFAFADPNMYPLFGLGYRFGESPEIFSVADPMSGLMFTNDVMPIKIRWYYSLGPIDHRGMFRHTVG